MGVKLLNDVRSKLAVPISETDTLVRVLAGHGVRFPVIDETGDWFPLAVENENGEIEYLRATARNSDTITVQRGQEGSVARAYPAGAACELRLTVGALTAHIEMIVDQATGGTGGSSNLAVVNVADGTLGAA